jgi:subtilisin family serine protease
MEIQLNFSKFAMRILLFSIFVVFSVSELCAQSSTGVRRSGDVRVSRASGLEYGDAFRGKDLRNPRERSEVVSSLREVSETRRERARQVARSLKRPLRQVFRDGRVREVADVREDGTLVYRTTRNANARITTGVSQAFSNYGLTGLGVKVGVWDAGAVRQSHREFSGGRVTLRNPVGVSNHATHVAGTIGASGVTATAMGMAPDCVIESFDWNNDISEMTANGATTSGDPSKLFVSNHSYGYALGWDRSGGVWDWYGSGTGANSVDPWFGLYSSDAVALDNLCYGTPYYLVVWAAGNDRGDNPASGDAIRLGGVSTTYNPSIHPKGDGVYRGGYETVGDASVAKNVLSVGAVTDAVFEGGRSLSNADLTSVSVWGPTDDGRIKPDVVGNGHTLYSTASSGDSSYTTLSGTSMASPNVAGSASLLIEHYSNLTGGSRMLSSSLRGLLIHTADDLESVGPDYKTGWGLINTLEASSLLSDHQLNPMKKRFKEDNISPASPVRNYQVYFDGTSPLKVTLAWTDPAGSVRNTADNRNPNLVNNLNLKVISPLGEEFFPYVMPFVGTWTQASMSLSATTGINNTDNVEQVYVEGIPRAGLYTISVSYSGVLQGESQSYSLFVSGSSYVNNPPVISPLDPYVINEDTYLTNAPFVVEDDLVPADELSYSATSSSQNVVRDEDIILEGNGSQRRLSLKPVANSHGQTTITITVSDGVNTVSSSFLLTVVPVNDPPTISPIASFSMPRNTTSSPIALDIADVDNSPESLMVNFESSNPSIIKQEGLAMIWGSPSFTPWTGRMLVITPEVDAYGTVVVTVNVSDGEDSVSTSFIVVVTNDSPTFNQWAVSNSLSDPTSYTMDSDGDGLSNLMEYFHGLNPNSQEAIVPIHQVIEGDNACLYYRKSRKINGVNARVIISPTMSSNGIWDGGKVVDELIDRFPEYEWRRASVSWNPVVGSPMFMRLEVTVD